MMSLFDRFRLDGKQLLITGGSRGLGREMAVAIAEAGADVILVGRNEVSLSDTARTIEEFGRRASILVCDVGRPEACEQMCKDALNQHGPIDILVNNVGGRRVPTPTEELATEDWQRILDLNLTSTFICTRIIGAAMRERGLGGRIINVASISGQVVNRGIGGRSYETSKAAVIQFTRTVAVDWARDGITANAICPGGFLTEPNLKWQRESPEVISAFAEQIPMGAFGEPADLGPLAVYLASDAARYMTGAALVIDGGYTLL